MFRRVLERDVFRGLVMSSPRRNNMQVVIGACELRTGTAFRFGNQKSGDWRHGEMVNGDSSLAFAVASSAAYPILLPALDRLFVFRKNGQERKERVLLTDGGIYDNLGIQVIEPGRDPTVSLHTFPCDYLIACNAGHGQESGEALPSGFVARVARSFGIVHRRVQDSAMHRLHQLKEGGQIKGFALPYLGQQDERLPWKPGTLVPRGEVVNYPTNFAPMEGEWIAKLSARGEQLTRILVSIYLSDILN
jgi:NTE family protein